MFAQFGEDGYLKLRTPAYNASFVQTLKAAVPPRARRWDSARRCWLIAPDWAQTGAAIFSRHFQPTPEPAGRTWADVFLAAMPPRLRYPAFRAVAKVIHPDNGGDTRLAQELNAARDRLRNAA